MNRGTVQIPKELINKYGLYRDHIKYVLLGYLFDNRSGCARVLKNHRGIRGLDIRLEKGQLAITHSWLMSDLGLSKKQVRLLLKWVEEETIFSAKLRAQQRAQQGAQQFTVLTLEYQNITDEDSQTGAQQSERQRAHSFQEVSKKGQEVKKKTSAPLRSAEVSLVKTELPEKTNRKVDVTEYMMLFSELTEQRFGFRPQIGAEGAAQVRRGLKKYGRDETVTLIKWFVNSDKAERLGCTLSHAFTDHTYNMFKQGVGNYGGQGDRKRSMPDRDDTKDRHTAELDEELEKIAERRRQRERGGA